MDSITLSTVNQKDTKIPWVPANSCIALSAEHDTALIGSFCVMKRARE